MSELLDMAQRYARQAGPFTPDESQLEAYTEGKSFAVEVVAETRTPGAHSRLLEVAVGMAATSRDDAFMRGVCAELQRTLAGGAA